MLVAHYDMLLIDLPKAEHHRDSYLRSIDLVFRNSSTSWELQATHM